MKISLKFFYSKIFSKKFSRLQFMVGSCIVMASEDVTKP